MDMENNKIEIKGKVARFPKGSKASNAITFLENIKVNPNKLWYIIIENQDNELRTVKYNKYNGVNLIEYTEQLKNFYLKKYENDSAIVEALNKITVEGEQHFSLIKNIPNIIIEEQLLLNKIMNDLITIIN